MLKSMWKPSQMLSLAKKAKITFSYERSDEDPTNNLRLNSTKELVDWIFSI